MSQERERQNKDCNCQSRMTLGVSLIPFRSHLQRGHGTEEGETNAPAVSMLRLPNKQYVCCCYCALVLLTAATSFST